MYKFSRYESKFDDGNNTVYNVVSLAYSRDQDKIYFPGMQLNKSAWHIDEGGLIIHSLASGIVVTLLACTAVIQNS
jgi:hypothetical protein